MDPIRLRKVIGVSVICFGAGIASSFFLSAYALVVLEAVAVIVSGALLLGKRR